MEQEIVAAIFKFDRSVDSFANDLISYYLICIFFVSLRSV